MESPICGALKNILDLFELSETVAFLSYKNSFECLWGICSHGDSCKNLPHNKKLWCVVDDREDSLRWLHIGIWGRYFRAKTGADAPRIILIGKNAFLNPASNKDILNLYVPEFYQDAGIKTIRFFTERFLVDLLNYIDEESSFPPRDAVDGWKALIYTTLTAEGHHHAVSNEVAPMILRRALDDSFGINLSMDGSDNESKALLKLWEWATMFLRTEKVVGISPSEIIMIDTYKINDIWAVWSKARFLLIDDQAKSNGYESILQSAIEMMIGKGTSSLVSKTNIKLKTDSRIDDSEIRDIIENYDCLFLDIRLNDADYKESKYKNLTGIKIVKQIWEKDRTFPVVIFSSSQKREIENILGRYKNVITSFRKPGVAGSAESLDGTSALKNLLSAIREALESLENRKVFKEFVALEQSFKRISKKDISIRIGTYSLRLNVQTVIGPLLDLISDRIDQILFGKRYELAFILPYASFERLFHSSIIDSHSIPDRLFKITSPSMGKVKLGQIDIPPGVSPININFKALDRLRNMAAHGIKDFSQARREAIVILLLFTDTLKSLLLNKKSAGTLSKVQIDNLTNYTVNQNPFTFRFEGNVIQSDKYVYDLFAGICHFGRLKEYEWMYKLWEKEMLP